MTKKAISSLDVSILALAALTSLIIVSWAILSATCARSAPQGTVAASVSSDSLSAVSGTEAVLRISLSNEGEREVSGASLAVVIAREPRLGDFSRDSYFIVTRAVIKEGISLSAHASSSLAFSWKIPSALPTGVYRADAVILEDGQVMKSPASSENAVFGKSAKIFVTGETEGVPFFVAAKPTDTAPELILVNVSGADVSFPVTFRAFKGGPDGQLLSTAIKPVSLKAGVTTTIPTPGLGAGQTLIAEAAYKDMPLFYMYSDVGGSCKAKESLYPWGALLGGLGVVMLVLHKRRSVGKIMVAIAFALLAGSIALPANAASTTGDPVGFLDSLSCSGANGWSLDPDYQAPPVYGCTDPAATNYNSSATQDNGSCSYPPVQCTSRYRWVNDTSGGRQNEYQQCGNVGATPAGSQGSGICASGENRPTFGNGYGSIWYSRGTWGGGNGGGGDYVMFQNGGYRCYKNGQKQDKDNTDVVVAFLCDFGSQYQNSCPGDYPPPPPPYTGPSYYDENYDYLLNWLPWDLFGPKSALAASGDSNSVIVYDGGTQIANIPANQYRPDVNAVMNVSGNHGFSWALPASLIDGNAHTLRFVGTNTDGNGSNAELIGSPRSVTCQPAVQNNAPSTPSLSCPASGSTVGSTLGISFSSSDDGSQVRYFIDWDNNGGVDQIVPSGGYASPNTTQTAYRAWPTAGTKTVRVSAEDNQGAVSGGATCSFTVVDAPVLAQCSDSVDNDGDGKTDYPADPGCTSPSDSDELDPGAPAICADGIDNDGDGKTDYPTDPGCTGTTDGDETDAPVAQQPVVTLNASPSTVTAPQNVTLSWSATDATACAASGGWSGAKFTSGSQSVYVSSSATYTLTCTGPGGTGNASRSVVYNTGGGGTDPGVTTGGGTTGGGTTGGGTTGSGVNQPGFTLSAVEGNIAPLRFIGQINGTSDSRRLLVNPVNGFTSPVNVRVASISSRSSGAALPASTTAAYSFDDGVLGASPTATFVYNPIFGQYTGGLNLIGITFKAFVNKLLPEAYNVTLEATGGGITTNYVITLDPNAIIPDFREI